MSMAHYTFDIKWSFFLCLILSINTLQAQEGVEPMDEGLVHEAFATPVPGAIALSSIPEKAPAPLNERTPPQPDASMQWIPGYWGWSLARHDFVWYSGIWRLPPHGMQWIPGTWLQVDGGWAWVRGFWSPQSAEQLIHIDIMPPDPIDERVSPPPNDNYFWQAGYWSYIPSEKNYAWIPGSWEEMDPKLMLVPAHYAWTSNGYVFIPAYWDYELEQRGRAYRVVYIQPASRINIVYEPTLLIEPQVFIQQLIAYYPDYLYLFYHHYHYHPELWVGLAPTWWGWNTWWSYPWHNHWALWWWYSHPHYPQPDWLTEEYSVKITPPSSRVFGLMEKAHPPYIVTPHGVVSPEKIFQANNNGKPYGKMSPVLPANTKALKEIQNRIEIKKNPKAILRPTGKPIQAQEKTNTPIAQPQKPVIHQEGRNIELLKKQNETKGKSIPQAQKLPSKPIHPSAPTVQKNDPNYTPHAVHTQPMIRAKEKE